MEERKPERWAQSVLTGAIEQGRGRRQAPDGFCIQSALVLRCGV